MNNRYGVDVPYFTKELAALSRSLPDRTPDELNRYLLRLAEVAKPLKSVERRSYTEYCLANVNGECKDTHYCNCQRKNKP